MSAWVTMPTGFVKSTIHAPGAAWRRASSASSRTTGTVRSALARPPGAGRLLADRAELQGEGLVEQARGLSADPELDQDEVGAVDGGARVIGQRQAAVPAEAGEHPLGQPADDFAALGVDVVERELVDRQAVAAVGETVDELGRVRATAADDRDLEAHSALRGIDRLLITL